jgi:hypothetical protein
MTRFTRQSLRLGLVGVLGALAIACASNPPPDNAVYIRSRTGLRLCPRLLALGWRGVRLGPRQVGRRAARIPGLGAGSLAPWPARVVLGRRALALSDTIHTAPA